MAKKFYAHHFGALFKGCRETNPEEIAEFARYIIPKVDMTLLKEVADENSYLAILEESHLYMRAEKTNSDYNIFLNIDSCNPNSDFSIALKEAFEKFCAEKAEAREWICDEKGNGTERHYLFTGDRCILLPCDREEALQSPVSSRHKELELYPQEL